LTIATSNLEIGPEDASYPGIKVGRYVRLSVADSGVGLTQDVKQHIFEPFFSTKGRKGTGLGLPTVYGIVTQSGGNVSVRSEPGKGATFDIVLPAKEPAEA
jgi:signal transduction histidine kinase